jgi:hypothetical protein
MTSRNPFVFVCGCPRSGTTLLQRMLDSHPRLAVANDTHFIPKAVDDGARAPDIPLSPAHVDSVLAYPRFSRLGIPEPVVRAVAAQARTYTGFVSGLYDQLGRMHGKPLAGEKTPDYILHLPLLHSLFPWAKAIHIVRDGRDVALSALGWAGKKRRGPSRSPLWDEEPIAVCALWWREFVRAGDRDGPALSPERYRDLRYEDLVDRPEEMLRELAGFLELSFAPEMLRYNEGKLRPNPKLSAKSQWLPPTPGLRDWRTEMRTRDVQLFEALAGDALEAHGYERVFDSIAEDVAELSASCREAWRSEPEVITGAASSRLS